MDEKELVKQLIQRYDYGGAYEILLHNGLHKTNYAKIINACRYSVNFDFKMANTIVGTVTKPYSEDKRIVQLKSDIMKLRDGHIEVLFSELLENMKFQIINEEYIDFLGRVYRFREAIYKYIFVRVHLNQKNFSFHNDYMQKKQILKVLRKKYKIYTSNLIVALNIFFDRNIKKKYKFQNALAIIDTNRMQNLIELRNDSLVGHGFMGVSLEDIEAQYGSPGQVVDDFADCLRYLDIKVNRDKYIKINQMIIEFMDESDEGGHYEI